MGKTRLRVFCLSALSTLGFFAGLVSASQSANAAEVTVSVLGLEAAAGAPDQVAAAVTEALRQRVTSTPGYRLIQGRDLVEVKLVFSCPDEAPPCMTQAAQSIGASKLIFGNVQPMGTDAYLVSLKLLDAERGVVETWISEQITKAQAAPAALRVPVQKWFGTLIGQTLPGTLKVSGGVVGAAVSIDGTQVGLMGADGLTIAGVAAGVHQLTISKAGYEKVERSVTLGSGALERISIAMKSTESPAAEAAATPAAQQAAPPAATESESLPAPEMPNQGARVGAWALLGLGIVGVGLGGYFSYEVSAVNSTLDRYRRYACPGSGALTCNANGTQNPVILSQADINYAQSEKNKGNTYATLQWVGYGVGAALLVTSGVLFYRGYTNNTTDGETAKTHSQHSNLVLLPTVAPNSVGALAYLRF